MGLVATRIHARSWFLIGLGAALAFMVPFVVRAAFDDVTLTSVTVRLTVGGSSFDVTADSATIESINVGTADTFDVVLRGSSTTTVTSATKTDFSVTPSTGVTITFTCGSSSSTLTLSGGNDTFTVRPQGNDCSAAGGSGASTPTPASGAGGGVAGSYGRSATPPAAPPATPPAASPPPAAAPAVSVMLVRNTSRGATGEDVRALQEFLARDPSIYPEGRISGYFGLLTEAAVKRFQARHGLPPVGRVGPLTRAKIEALSSAAGSGAGGTPAAPPAVAASLTQTLQREMSGDAVARIQAFLARDPTLYPEGRVTGYFGQLTEAAVKRFQERHGIDAIGIVGPKTRAKLNELMAGSQ